VAYLLSALVLIIGLFLAWFTGAILHLEGTSLLLSRILFILIGVGGAIAILWLHLRSRRTAAATPSGPANTNDLDSLLRDASARLASAQRTGPKAFDSLPLLYILGDDNSGKTTTILKSSLDPELLAGQVYRDQQIVPTTVVNLFYSQQCALIEAGAAVRKDPRLWSRVIKRTRPRAYRSLFGKAAPVRAAVVCVSSESFLGTAAAEATLASARTTGQMLRDLSQQLGIEVPVYVILTKLDRVPNFNEFVRNLSNEEATQVFGISLPRSAVAAGLYADQATKDIGLAVDKLAFSLGEFRLDLLPRESDQSKLPGIYEFPRELRKLRNNLTAYLVELTRLSQLNTNPYLRGFYFTGVRAQMVDQVVTSAAAQPQPSAQANAGATQIFSIQQAQAAQAAPVPQVVSQKVAQWSFLPRLFPQVILGDKSALANTGKTGRANFFRRFLFGAAAALFFVYLCLLAVSFAKNSALEKQITAATDALPINTIPPTSLAPEHDLASLDQLRAAIVQLEGYQTNGAPLMYRWGLYHGGQLLDGARNIYFDRFRRLLLNNTQNNLVTYLSALPATPDPAADYDAAYAPLRAYLITTTNPEKSTPEFLSPVLMQYWQNTRTPDSDQQRILARRQFDFYADELRRANPYAIAPVMPAVTHARTYLSNFGGFERIYQSMLTAAGKVAPAIDFNHAYPHSAETVVETHIVPGAFTKPGYAFMQDAIKHPDRYFSGEAWVLGDQAPPSLDRATLTQQLTTRYIADFLTQWRTFATCPTPPPSSLSSPATTPLCSHSSTPSRTTPP
jgi:type VI secretion system protein ImpL